MKVIAAMVFLGSFVPVRGDGEPVFRLVSGIEQKLAFKTSHPLFLKDITVSNLPVGKERDAILRGPHECDVGIGKRDDGKPLLSRRDREPADFRSGAIWCPPTPFSIKGQSAGSANRKSWCLPIVFVGYGESIKVPLIVASEPNVTYGDVGSNLLLSDFSIDLVPFSGRRESAINKNKTKAADAGPNGGYYKYAKSPFSHIPLSGKVVLGALMLMGGFYYLQNAFIGRRKAILLNYFAGLAGVSAGVIVCVYAIFGI